MKQPPAFQLYVDDFVSGVADMTQAEVGSYILLLCSQWNRGSIPVEAERQQLLVKGPVTPHVLAKFDAGPDGGLRNARLESVRAKQQAYHTSQQEKGHASARARSAKKANRRHPGVIAAASTAVNAGLQPEGNSPTPTPNNTPIVPTGDGNLGKGPIQLRAEALMRRRPETPLTAGEARAFRKNRDAMVATTEADWKCLETFYEAPQEETFARKDLAALVNNWNGEIDRARAWCERRQPTTSYRLLNEQRTP